MPGGRNLRFGLALACLASSKRLEVGKAGPEGARNEAVLHLGSHPLSANHDADAVRLGGLEHTLMACRSDLAGAFGPRFIVRQPISASVISAMRVGRR